MPIDQVGILALLKSYWAWLVGALTAIGAGLKIHKTILDKENKLNQHDHELKKNQASRRRLISAVNEDRKLINRTRNEMKVIKSDLEAITQSVEDLESKLESHCEKVEKRFDDLTEKIHKNQLDILNAINALKTK